MPLCVSELSVTTVTSHDNQLIKTGFMVHSFGGYNPGFLVLLALVTMMRQDAMVLIQRQGIHLVANEYKYW